MQHDGGALDGVAVLVEVGGDGCDTGDAEVPWRDVVAGAFEEREHETAETGVDVEWDAAF